MPIAEHLPHRWYDTPNIHLCTFADFESLCRKQGLRVIERFVVDTYFHNRPLINRFRTVRQHLLSPGTTAMRRLFTFVAGMLFAVTTAAEQFKAFGDIEVHYAVVDTLFRNPKLPRATASSAPPTPSSTCRC
jgi:hypothetical protein